MEFPKDQQAEEEFKVPFTPLLHPHTPHPHTHLLHLYNILFHPLPQAGLHN
jgi:hypothetical protein